MDNFECTMVQIVGEYKIPTKLKAFAKTAAKNLMINYFKSPKFAMYIHTKQMKLKAYTDYLIDAQGEIEFEDQEDTEQKLADELYFEVERKEFFDKEVEIIKSKLTTRNKALKQKIIDLYVRHYLKNSEIVVRLKKNNQHLIPEQMTDKKLLALVVNTLFQLRTEMKEQVKKFN
jgi:DNA-directed RNA polymerase specialized sigma24 family protein